jgi:hypothetical protein
MKEEHSIGPQILRNVREQAAIVFQRKTVFETVFSYPLVEGGLSASV